MSSGEKKVLLTNAEKFLQKEIAGDRSEEKVSKLRSFFKYLPEDDCFAIFDLESSIKCVFDKNYLDKYLHSNKLKLEEFESKVICFYFHFDLYLFILLSFLTNLQTNQNRFPSNHQKIPL